VLALFSSFCSYNLKEEGFSILLLLTLLGVPPLPIFFLKWAIIAQTILFSLPRAL
jgi:formate hydrogenlyase subunit 3/multisubunit Na+/H+ antiporter MnhD subunit